MAAKDKSNAHFGVVKSYRKRTYIFFDKVATSAAVSSILNASHQLGLGGRE